jgi:PAS domain S-box-containing protein
MGALPLGVALVDRDGRTLVANSVYRRIFPDLALSQDEARHHLWVAHDGDGNPLEHKDYPVARALRGDMIWPGQELQFSGDPERGPFWVRLGALPLFNGKREIVGATVVLTDIDAQKRSDVELAEQRRLYKSVTDNATMALFIMDERQQCVFMNPAAEAMTGFTPAEIRGRPLHEALHHTRPDGRPYPLSECPIDQAFPKNDREQGEEVFVHKNGPFYPVAFTASPIRDGSGAPIGTVIEVQDISERKKVEDTLGRQVRMLDLSKEAIFTWRLHGGIESWNEGATTLYGYSRQEALGRLNNDLLATKPVSAELTKIFAALEDTGSWRGELVHQTREGRSIVVESSMQVFRQGETALILESNRDVTERKRAEQALALANRRHEVAQAAARAMNYEYLPSTGEVIRSQTGFEQLTGYAYNEVPANSEWWRSILHPDDVTGFWSAIEAGIASGRGFVIDYRIRTSQGHYLWVHDHAAVLSPGEGEPVRVYGMVLDISEQKAREEQVKLLLREVNHRAKNMLGLVQSIASQTVASNPTEFLQRFGGRLQALAANHDLLVSNTWAGVGVEALVRAQLAMFEDLLGTRIRIRGPQLELNASAAQAIGLAVHELATNAAKYGALSSPCGRVQVSWGLVDNRLMFNWQECDGPTVAQPTRKGFGTLVLTALAKMSVSGEVKLDYAESGLAWQLSCPAERVLEHGGLGNVNELELE